MTSVAIRAGDYQYEAVVGRNLFATLGVKIGAIITASRCAVVSDSKVEPLFGSRVRDALNSAGLQPTPITIPAGEESKTLEQAGSICDQMIAMRLDRHSFVVGLGGGVVGDLSGFVAAIFERGIPHVQIPTTLLAMVDSSIGGKTGVNTSAAKNLIGAIHHPAMVIDDLEVLQTLPVREFRQGFAEIIKHAVIADAEMFEQLNVAHVSGLQPGETAGEMLAPLIHRNIEIKASIVAKDEFDRTGERALLNFGHTIGHAIERAGEYREFLHGEAISLGMVAACAISQTKAGLPPEQGEAMVDLLRKFKLPTRLPPDFPRKKILAALLFDKKFEGGKTRFVLTPAIGSAYLSSDVTMNDISEAIEAL
jgi:3-dehydroquinate synthase